MNFSSPATQYVGKQFVHYATADSTNHRAQQLLREQRLSSGAIVHADFQTAGRGQQTNQWESAAGQNLTLSVVTFPELPVEQQYWLTVAVSLSLHDTLHSWLSDPVAIKWPNDILCESNKICGILIQNNLKGRMIQSTVIGIGLNVNQDQFAAPRATSLALQTGQYWDRTEVLRRLATALEQRLEQLARKELASLKSAYLRQLFWRGERHRFEDQHGSFYGAIVGIDEAGRLAVEVEDSVRYYDNKQLVYCF